MKVFGLLIAGFLAAFGGELIFHRFVRPFVTRRA